MSSIFVDKNIFFNHARASIFGENLPFHSTDIINKINSSNIQAFIHESTIFSLSNYIKYRYTRPNYKHGLSLDLSDADKKSRDFCKQTFKQNRWNLISLSYEETLIALSDNDFDFEDAIQFYSFVKSKCTHLITWNEKDFARAGSSLLNPKKYLSSYANKG